MIVDGGQDRCSQSFRGRGLRWYGDSLDNYKGDSSSEYKYGCACYRWYGGYSSDDTEVTALALMKSSVHIDGRFAGGSIDRFVLTRYDDHMTFKL